MGRRGKGEGSIYKRADGRWVAQAPMPDGSRKYKTSEKRSVVAAWLADTQQRIKQGQMIPNERLTVRAYLDSWLGTVKQRHNLEAHTHERYTSVIRKHVIPALGRVPLNQLSVPHLRAFYDQKQQEMKPSSLRTVHAVVRSALQDALVDELVYRNVAAIVKPAPAKQQRRAALSPEEANKLLAQAEKEQNRWEALYWLALNTAMREGELLALRWSDIDFAQKRLHIRAAKTDAGVRSPGLISQVIDKLHQHRHRLMEERMRAGPRWQDQGPFEQGLVFPNTIGKKQTVSGFLYMHYYPLLERAELPRVVFHSLRHTAISWLLSLGIPVIDVAAYVGHADATTTLRVYAHSFPGSQQAMLEAMERSRAGGNKS